MDTVDAILDRAKDVLGITTDYALAKRLGVTQQAVANYRHGKTTPEPAIAGLLAEIIGRPPLEVIAIIEGDRESSRPRPRPKILEFWRRHGPRLLPAVVAAAIVGTTEGRSPTAEAELTERSLPDIHSAYWRRLARAVLALAAKTSDILSGPRLPAHLESAL